MGDNEEEGLLKNKIWEPDMFIIYLVSNVVGEPIQPLIKSLSRGGTSALDVPDDIQVV